jgi:hypothetical protein
MVTVAADTLRYRKCLLFPMLRDTFTAFDSGGVILLPVKAVGNRHNFVGSEICRVALPVLLLPLSGLNYSTTCQES